MSFTLISAKVRGWSISKSFRLRHIKLCQQHTLVLVCANFVFWIMQIRSRDSHRLKKLYRLHNLYSNHLQSQSVFYCVSWWYYTLVIDPLLLVNYVTMLCCCSDYQLSEAPLTPLFGLNWYVTAGEQFYYFASWKEYLFGHGNPNSSVKVSVPQSSFVLLKALP